MIYLLPLILFVFVSTSNQSQIQSRILYSAALKFLPALKVHHIVIFSNLSDNKVYAIDFTPINQTSFGTLSKLFLGQNVPAEIRKIHLDDSHFFDADEFLIQQWIEKHKNGVSTESLKIKDWNAEMNLYTHNCQHFSKWIMNYDIKSLFAKNNK